MIHARIPGLNRDDLAGVFQINILVYSLSMCLGDQVKSSQVQVETSVLTLIYKLFKITIYVDIICLRVKLILLSQTS